MKDSKSSCAPDTSFTFMRFFQQIGMSIVVHVGNQTDLPPIPEGFPTCGVSSCQTRDLRGTPKTCEPNKAVIHENMYSVFFITVLAYIIYLI